MTYRPSVSETIDQLLRATPTEARSEKRASVKTPAGSGLRKLAQLLREAAAAPVTMAEIHGVKNAMCGDFVAGPTTGSAKQASTSTDPRAIELRKLAARVREFDAEVESNSFTKAAYVLKAQRALMLLQSAETTR